jgi:hypothetical protein
MKPTMKMQKGLRLKTTKPGLNKNVTLQTKEGVKKS